MLSVCDNLFIWTTVKGSKIFWRLWNNLDRPLNLTRALGKGHMSGTVLFPHMKLLYSVFIFEEVIFTVVKMGNRSVSRLINYLDWLFNCIFNFFMFSNTKGYFYFFDCLKKKKKKHIFVCQPILFTLRVDITTGNFWYIFDNTEEPLQFEPWLPWFLYRINL